MNKFQQITAVFNEEISTVTQNQNNWTSFLKTAANNYKYNFVEQILIHAQRPDATACAEIEVWNEKFGRWVNRGARGIALFDYSGSYQKLRYVFDVSDTNSFYGNEVKLWSVSNSYEEEVKEALSNAFGEAGEGSLAAVIDDTAINMAEDNAADYLEMITDFKHGSFLEELDNLNVEAVFKSALSNSIGYMLMTRCGIDADAFYDSSDFRDVMNFNTSSLAISLGTAVSEIAEMGLREIESTVRNLQKSERKPNRTFDKSKENEYDEGTNTERSNDNGTDSIQTGGRLPDPEHHNAATREQTARQIRNDEKDIFAEQQESSFEHSVDQGRTDEPSLRDRHTGERDDGTIDQTDDEITEHNGTTQGNEPDEMGTDDEQYSELGTGNGAQRSDLQLSGHDFDARGNGIDYYHQNKEKNELIKTYLASYKDEIAAFFEVHSDKEERSDFVMSFFDSKPFEMTLSNGVKAGLEAYEDAIYFWRTDRNDPSHECWERWFQIRDSVYGMILLEQWTEPQALLLPNVDTQLSILEAKTKKDKSHLHLPQAAIDYILCRGSGVSEGKMRIYRQFAESLSKEDNIRFLKKEYGIGGHSDAIPGTGYWENHDAKGIAIEDWHGEPKRKILLSWQQVEKRIAELIKIDRYLNSKEKEMYPQWLEKQEELRIKRAEEAERRKTLHTAPPEPKEYMYEYHLGDTVYIGADEYTITSLSDPVILNDSKFPLFSTEMPRAEFDLKVQENPANDHLKVVVTKEPAKQEDDIVNELFSEELIIEKQISDNPIWNEYQSIKAENPDSIVFYQLGDFFEIMGEDANTVAEALDVVLTSRKVSDNEKIPMCGIPSHRLETYLGMMNDRGYDVTLSTFENGERKNRLIVSQNKEDPVESQPIGRINYLHTDGSVRESIEYTSEYKLKKDIQEENFYGVPMTVTLYRDKGGKVVPHEYILDCDPPLQGFAIIDSPYILPPEEEINDDDLIGKEVTIDDRKYVIESVGKISGDVSMRDVTFQNGTGFPINRVEKIEYVKTLIDKQEIKPTWKQQPKQTSQSTIPESEKHNYKITDDNLGIGGAKEKFRNNMAAINLLHELEFENRLATPEEQEILARYVGFGGLADAFDETKKNWGNEFTELYTVLSPEEYSDARESTLTAFYTPPVVINAMYQALSNMGFTNGNILEPSCGVGNFMGLLPDSMKDSKFYGVELDSVSGRIAKQLYQKANIAVQGYEKTALPDSFFDVAIGNVPFGQFKVLDKKYDKNNWLIHDYFFGKTLDKVRPGGLIAFITSSGTMDKKNPAVRKYIAQRAELLGAIRLPNNTFKANAGTEVTSDILFLQKRDTLTAEEPSWVHLGIDSNGHEMNQYFIDNPDMVLGEMVMESSQYGQSLTCKPYENRELSDLLSEAIQNIHAEFTEYDLSEIGEDENLESIPADPNVKNFGYTIVDGKVYYRENSRMNLVNMSVTAMNRIKGMIEIRDCVRTLIELQTEDYSDNAIKAEQEKLNTLYDNFTKKYGLINSRANNFAFSADSSYYLLCSLEVIGENGELKRKADMFTKRTIKPNIKVTSVATASEALAVSIGEKACVDMDFMQELTGKTESEIFEDLKGVIFLNPEPDGKYNEYLTADEYLSGNVRKKLEIAKRSAELYPEDYSINVEMLEKVQPEELNASEISVRLGATWLPESDVQDFIFETLQTPRYAQWNIKVHYSKYTAEWNIENKSYDRTNVMANSTYGTDRINAYKIIEETLNLKDVRIFDYVEDEYGNKKPVLNKKETAIAQGKQELIKQAFQDWIWQNPERRQRLEKKYNELFNSERSREYDGSHIKFSGMNLEITLRPHQINAVARIMYGGNTLLAHVVGAGKTFEIVAAAQESKRLGLCNKSLIVVPNHLTEQWASEYLQLYPSANILVATKKDFETKNRKKFCARIATGDYDAVIIGHSQFEKIPLSVERQQLMLQQQIEEITEGISEMKSKRGERFTVKQLEKTKKNLQAKLDKLNDQSRKDNVITFEELGIDRLFVDEAHNFKNLFLVTKMRNVGGIAQTEAQKSSDLYMKCRYLDEVTNSKGVIFATGTPVSNSMVELYTMQRYLQYETLKDKNLQHFDSWASTFGETVTAIELAPEGTGYRSKTRFAKFYNLPELMMMFRQVADIQTADMLKLPVPDVMRKTVTITPSDMQKELVAALSERAERVRNKMVDSSVDNMLLITNDGRKLALDQRLSNAMLPDDPNGKVATCADNVYEIWERTTPQKLAQLVFCDLSTPHNDGKFNVYDDMRTKLIAKGIPEKEIAFIHSADTETKKKDLFAKVRSGQVRILIGSTFKMGAGTNVQKRLIAEHHLDCPWRPADLEQREGRIIRQGNENPTVEIYTYITKETFDAYLYQLVENKQKFIGQIMTSKSPV
ncbi:MAG: SNF2-related protein, partial [Ruminococcus sp.]|nr:SNF2-related protein [Ruminococcus sp.]